MLQQTNNAPVEGWVEVGQEGIKAWHKWSSESFTLTLLPVIWESSLLANSDPFLLLPLSCPGVWGLIVHLCMQCFLRNFPLHLLGFEYLSALSPFMPSTAQFLPMFVPSFFIHSVLLSQGLLPVSTGPAGASLLGFSVGINKYTGNLLDTKQYTFSIALEEMWLSAVSPRVF